MLQFLSTLHGCCHNNNHNVLGIHSSVFFRLKKNILTYSDDVVEKNHKAAAIIVHIQYEVRAEQAQDEKGKTATRNKVFLDANWSCNER